MNFDAHRSLVFGSQVIAVLLVVASLVGQRAELRSQRPGARQDDAFKSETLRVRLWDDPFRVLRELNEALARTGPEDHAARLKVEQPYRNIAQQQELAGQMVGASSAPPAGQMVGDRPALPEKTLILMIVLDGRSTPEAEELRLRSRYAVVSALSTAGYRPVSDWGIWPFLAKACEQGNPVGQPIYGNMVWEPFQTQQIRSEGYLGVPLIPPAFPEVYVCWIRGDKVRSEQLFDQAVRDSLVSEMGMQDPASRPQDFVIFDLGGSDRLHGFLREMGDKRAEPPAQVYFLHATLSDWLLKAALNSDRSSHAVRLAQEDFYQIDALWRELKHRLPVLEQRAKRSEQALGQIVLFIESDTTYSQGIALDMQTALIKARDELLDRGWRLRIFTYLRGLDGRQGSPSARSAAEGAATHEPLKALLSARVLSEESSGTSQFDYLRRQALLLKLDHLKEPVVAVGVLGSDVYDKLIVLQALRPELPQAVFFTTDLDALYLHADNVEVTRNLLVASANGLRPEMGGGEDRWNVPPMRDSYQTILFEATQRLVRSKTLEERSRMLEDVAYRNGQEAMLFEIGAGTAVLLRQFSRDAQTAMVARLGDRFWNLLIFALALGNGILVLWAVSSRQDAPADERKPAPLRRWASRLLWAECAFAILAILGLAGLFFYNWIWGEPEPVFMMEPLSWTSGVSIWPTILIRCLAFLIALLLMIKASETVDVKHRLARRRLQHLLGTGARLRSSALLELSCAAVRLLEAILASLRFQKAWLRQRWSDFGRQVARVAPQDREPRTIEQLLETIHGRPHRVVRITALAIIYLAVSIFLFAVFPTYTPGRGFAVLLAEKVVLSLGVGLYIVHLLYCLDLHLGAQMLLEALRGHLAENKNIDEYKVLETAGEYTVAVGRTLLYPFTVLIIIMLSRIRLFDAWSMTPSLWIVLGAGAVLLTGASLVIVSEARRMREEALERAREKKREIETERPDPGETQTASLQGNMQSQIVGIESRIKELRELEVGAFSHWYQQPIFAALVSLLGVLGTIGFAEPVVELLVR
ncbi:MAG: hypothetical protein ABW214_06710 [Terrimicrobiaceae bacterium]